MQVRQFNALAAARRANAFLISTPPAPPLASMPATFTQQVQTLGATIAQIDAQGSAQTAAGGTIVDKVAAAIEAAKELRSGHLSPIKKVAKILVQGSTGGSLSPSFADSIVVPEAQNHAALLSAASAAVQLVTPYKDLFINRGLPTDFLDQLSAQASVLSEAIQATGVAKRTRASTTTDLEQLFHELRSTLHVLEIGVTKACKVDRVNGPGTMTAWKNARTIRKVPTLTDIPFPQTVTTSGATPAPASTAPATAVSSHSTTVVAQTVANASTTQGE